LPVLNPPYELDQALVFVGWRHELRAGIPCAVCFGGQRDVTHWFKNVRRKQGCKF